MIELLYTTLTLFGVFLIMFFLFPTFKSMKIIIVFFQLIVSIILLFNVFYKKHSLYELPKFEYIQKTDFAPIKSLYETFDENGEFKDIKFETLSNTEFSFIKTQKYSQKCLENYYLEKNVICPITDIKLEEEPNDKYSNYNQIQISDNEFLYFTNDNKLGKLYKSFKYLDFKNNIEDSFDINIISRKENNKLSNPIIKLKNYINICDLFILICIFVSLYYSFMEYYSNFKYNQFEYLNILTQLEILVLYILRFLKFIKVKDFLFDNKDIYDNDDESYFPNKYFNIDSFPLAVTINIFIYNILYLIFPNKISILDKNLIKI